MKVVEKRYLLPFILITTLFALWGVAANMTDTLLAAFRKVMQMSDTQTTFIQMAFYGAYFFIALPAALFIRKHSYKSGVILGLILYATGAILFLPAAWVGCQLCFLSFCHLCDGYRLLGAGNDVQSLYLVNGQSGNGYQASEHRTGI